MFSGAFIAKEKKGHTFLSTGRLQIDVIHDTNTKTLEFLKVFRKRNIRVTVVITSDGLMSGNRELLKERMPDVGDESIKWELADEW